MYRDFLHRIWLEYQNITRGPLISQHIDDDNNIIIDILSENYYYLSMDLTWGIGIREFPGFRDLPYTSAFSIAQEFRELLKFIPWNGCCMFRNHIFILLVLQCAHLIVKVQLCRRTERNRWRRSRHAITHRSMIFTIKHGYKVKRITPNPQSKEVRFNLNLNPLQLFK